MQTIIIDIMNKFGYLGVTLLIALENIFPPIPSEIVLTFGGFMTQRPNSEISVLGVIIFSTIGSLIGAVTLYFVGKILNKERLKKIVSGKIGKVLFLKESDIEKADKWFDTKGNGAVFFGRFIPIVRSLISIPAGMSGMPFFKFIIYTTSGSIIWNTISIVLGSIVGENWEAVSSVIGTYSKIILLILIALFVLLIVLFYSKRVKQKN